MNNSTLIFLINDDARAIRTEYEPDGTTSVFKSMDPNIEVGDYVITETTTRHNMTVTKVTEVDVDLDLEISAQIGWIVGRVDIDPYKELLDQERAAIATVQSAERRRKRDELRASVLKNAEDDVQALALASPVTEKE